jgi:ribokinase
MSNNIVVIGSINMDLVLVSQRIPNQGESLIGEKYFYSCGGKGANQAVALKRLGADTRMIGRVGNDNNGLILKRQLTSEGINTESVICDQNSSTGLAVIMLDSEGNNRISVFPAANMRVEKNDFKVYLDNPSALLIQFEIPVETVIEACKICIKKNIITVVDAGPAQDFPLEKIKGVTVLSPNETEAEVMCGFPVTDEQSAYEACKLLMKRSAAKYIVLKRGCHGAALFDGGNFEVFPVKNNAKVVDTTAAGDCFTAALTLKLLECKDIRSAIQFANLAASVKVSRMGAQSAMPYLYEVERG